MHFGVSGKVTTDKGLNDIIMLASFLKVPTAEDVASEGHENRRF